MTDWRAPYRDKLCAVLAVGALAFMGYNAYHGSHPLDLILLAVVGAFFAYSTGWEEARRRARSVRRPPEYVYGRTPSGTWQVRGKAFSDVLGEYDTQEEARQEAKRLASEYNDTWPT